MQYQVSQPGVRSNYAFRLLTRATDTDESLGSCLALGGIRWTLVESEQVPAIADARMYTAISYSWGSGRAPSPFDEETLISDHTFAAIAATIEALQPSAIWVDALCVPAMEPARSRCLRSMGAIFAAATQVAVVLSTACAKGLGQIRTTGRLDPAELIAFETDDWVTRMWTYQEIANSQAIHFITDGGRGAVEGPQLLNALGQAIQDYQRSANIEATEFLKRYPHVDALESTLADYMISNNLQRFAFQVMTAMNGRYTDRGDDHIAAMIGAITATELDSQLAPVDAFLRACEAKGDFSFVYCVAPRSTVPGRGWRPESMDFAAVLSWHTYGDGQPGELFPTHLRLDHMCRMAPGPLNPEAAKFVSEWACSGELKAQSVDLANAVYERLKRMGFAGHHASLEMQTGYFFSQTAVATATELEVVVPAQVRWVHGAPALLVSRNGAEMYRFVDVGVFVGLVPRSGKAVRIA